MRTVPMRYTTTPDGVRIAYASFGDGPALVFASNIWGDLNALRFGEPNPGDVTDRLVNLGWRVVRYDVRGMGASDRAVNLSLEGRVLDLASVVDALSLERFAVAAIDCGTPTAIAYVATKPHNERVTRLVLWSAWASSFLSATPPVAWSSRVSPNACCPASRRSSTSMRFSLRTGNR
ncbi:MAG TPA: alpha/beta hydrolase [Vicinamibacterales bacterium]|nr:alpha/beta hydrolase [Vicinamibacterales bacterium]